jgi:4'-phosphopantetheinyl transferase
MLGNETLWSCTPIDSGLLSSAVQVWAAWLDAEEVTIEQYQRLLCRQECERASRFAFQRERERFIAARGLLRTILGTFLGADPRELEFIYSATGKPSLGGDFTDCGLEFNLAHSGGLGVFAVSGLGAVGIDVEQVRPVPEYSALSERFFTPHECALINTLPRDEAIRAFFQIWILKEAWLKATGEGIAGLSGSADLLSPPGLEDFCGGPPNGRFEAQMSLYCLAPAPGFLGGLAIINRGMSKPESVAITGLERVMGIEPTWPAWKAGALPLSYTRTDRAAKCSGRGLNVNAKRPAEP